MLNNTLQQEASFVRKPAQFTALPTEEYYKAQAIAEAIFILDNVGRFGTDKVKAALEERLAFYKAAGAFKSDR